MGSVAAVFFSHPDESNIVEKIIAMNVERSVVFMGLTRTEQMGICEMDVIAREGEHLGLGSRGVDGKAARVAVLERERKNQ